jgi:hypothetical protein
LNEPLPTGRQVVCHPRVNSLAEAFIQTMAGAVAEEATLAEQVAAAAVLICRHRQGSVSTPRGLNQSLLILLLEHGGDELMRRSVELWKPLVKGAHRAGEVDHSVDPVRASKWIFRLLFSSSCCHRSGSI